MLGGSPKDVPKESKLAALAASRKRKTQELPNKSSNTESSPLITLASGSLGSGPNVEARELSSLNTRLSGRRQESSIIAEPSSRLSEETVITPVEEVSETIPLISSTVPSAFASVLLGLGEQTPKPKPFATSYNLYDYICQNMDANPDPFSEPSPDDIVAKAQSESKGMKAKAQPKPNDQRSNKIDRVTEDLSKATISESKPLKSKNLDVVEEFRKSNSKTTSNFVVIGD